MASDRVIVDASYILESILPTTQAGRDDANDLIDGLASGQLKAVVPWIFYCEIAATCARAVRGRRIDDETAREFMDLVINLGIDIEVKLDPPSVIYDGAMRTGAQAYDSMYVTLAESMDLPVATVDRGMRTAARSLKVTLFSPGSPSLAK